MKQLLTALCLTVVAAFVSTSAHAQAAADAPFVPSGKLSMQFFADYNYWLNADTATGAKGHVPAGKTYYVPVDPQNLDGQGGINQRYSSTFDLRRVYLGYDYQFSKNVSAQLLLSHENGTNLPIASTAPTATTTYDTAKKAYVTTVTAPTTYGSGSGDIVLDGNRGLFLKGANVQFKNIIPHGTLIFGQQGTAAFGVAEQIWGYRSMEKTIADMRGNAQSNDLGIQAKGAIDDGGAYNYSVMISNGNGAKTENDKYKKFALDLNGKFMENHVLVDVYADYMDKTTAASVTTKATATPLTATNVVQNNTTIKLTAGYVSDPITVGVEYLMQTLKGQSTFVAGSDAAPSGLSVFLRGTIMEKQLSWFARYDMYDPDSKSTTTDALDYQLGANYKETFLIAGLDWQPDAGVNAHIVPNIWMDSYKDKSSLGVAREGIMVGRMSFTYKF